MIANLIDKKLSRRVVWGAILYGRFSPRPNASECDSVEYQLAYGRRWCGQREIDVCGEYFDKDLSGGLGIEEAGKRREGLHAAIGALRPGMALVVYSLSRLVRGTDVAIDLERAVARKRARLISIAGEGAAIDDDFSDPQVVLLRRIMQALDEFQRTSNAKGTSLRMRTHQSGLRRMSDIVPYGTRRNGEKGLAIATDERWVIAHRIVPLFEAGICLAEICRILVANGIDFRGRLRWRRNTVKKILMRERLIA